MAHLVLLGAPSKKQSPTQVGVAIRKVIINRGNKIKLVDFFSKEGQFKLN